MAKPARFPEEIVALVREGPRLGIRAGRAPHRVIGIWAVVVEGRVFVRSWSLEPRSWWRTFLEDPTGIIEVGTGRLGRRRLEVRAVQTRSERLKDAVDRAYLEKYASPGAVKYARDLGRAKSRATTTELVPLPRSRRPTGR